MAQYITLNTSEHRAVLEAGVRYLRQEGYRTESSGALVFAVTTTQSAVGGLPATPGGEYYSILM